MFDVIAWNSQNETVVDTCAERGTAEQVARELDAKAKGNVAHFARRRRDEPQYGDTFART